MDENTTVVNRASTSEEGKRLELGQPGPAYFEEDGISIYHGDSREILPLLQVSSIITDPVWPNASKYLIGCENPSKLFAEIMAAMPESVSVLTVHLGILSDPRFLSPIPQRLPFFRVCSLPMLPVSFCGRAVNGGDIAYIFGVPPGHQIIGGQSPQCGEKPLFPRRHGRNRSSAVYQTSQGRAQHPAPRKLAHVRWLMARFGLGIVADPYCGTGTTLVAAKACGLPAIGIEIEERYCEISANRLRQAVLEFEQPISKGDDENPMLQEEFPA